MNDKAGFFFRNPMKTEMVKTAENRPETKQVFPDEVRPEMFTSLQSAYAEAAGAHFELERRAAQLMEMRDLYQTIIASMSEAFFLTNLAGRIVMTNAAAARLLECEEAAILGANLSELCGRQDVPSTPWELLRLSKIGRIDNLEFDMPTTKGRRVPVSLACSIIGANRRKITGVLAIAHDIRQTRLIIDDLAAARNSYEDLLDFAPEAMILTDRTGKISMVNAKTEALFGYPRQELIGRTIGVLFPPRLREKPRDSGFIGPIESRATLNRIAIDAPVEYCGLTKNGVEFPIELIQRQIETAGRQVTMSLMQDISARKRLESEREKRFQQEQEARRQAEEANRIKDEFLVMVSHEMRAPLTAILGWTQLLRSDAFDRKMAEHALLTIERNVKSQTHLISDLLDASRIANGKMRLEKRHLELIPLIEAALDAVRAPVKAKNLRLRLALDPWVGPFIGDPERIKQVIWNLLSNAVKFTDPGGLIEITLEKLENKALLIVSDTGLGIDPDFLPHIFDRFRQAEGPVERSQSGLGLGLSIVKFIVEAHGGAIYAYSAGLGRGSDFMITLPLAEEPEPPFWGSALDRFKNASDGRRTGGLESTRVLVVDDDRDTREVLAAMLNRYGAESRVAASAAEGFSMLRSWRPDALVSDISMPVEDGYSFIRRIRALPASEGGAVPSIALTAFATSQDRDMALSTGFQLHIAKPIEPVHLARAVARLIGRNETEIK
jgi:PAS domain S-box-containing protein